VILFFIKFRIPVSPNISQRNIPTPKLDTSCKQLFFLFRDSAEFQRLICEIPALFSLWWDGS
jgi:hypothetical protein